VLIAEGQDDVVGLLRDVLAPSFDVETSNDGQGALSRALHGNVDVVVAAVRLPKLSGFELLHELKRETAAIEVVLMAADTGVEHAIEAIRAGAFDYLTLPFQPKQVLSKIERAAQQRNVRRQGRLSERSYKDAMNAAHERAAQEYLRGLLEECQGNVSQAAARAHVARESLHRLLKRHGVHSTGFRRLNRS